MTSAGPRPGLIGTDILRGVRRGDQPALDFIDELMAHGRYHVSQLSVLTLVADATDAGERAGLGLFFSWCVVLPLNVRVVARARLVLDRLPPPAGLTADDALVAATALIHKLPLYTLDPGRFAAVPGLTAIRPY